MAVVTAALVVMMVGFLALPGRTNAVVGWSLTAHPTTLLRDEEVDVRFTLADTLLLGPIGCLHIEVPKELDVRDARVTDTSDDDDDWDVDTSGGELFESVEVFPTGGSKLTFGEWVKFTVTLRPRTPGVYVVTGHVHTAADCDGLTLY